MGEHEKKERVKQMRVEETKRRREGEGRGIRIGMVGKGGGG